MKALTLYQPHAQLVALGVQKIVTRSGSTKYRGPLAIHAGKETFYTEHPDGNVVDTLGVLTDLSFTFLGRHDLFGAVVATCELVDVVPIVPWALAHNGCVYVCEFGAECDATLWYASSHKDLRFGGTAEDISDQLFYGDFRLGRYAWIFERIQQIEPVRAKGRRGLWEWPGNKGAA